MVASLPHVGHTKDQAGAAETKQSRAMNAYVSNLEHELNAYRNRAKSAEEQTIFLRKQTQELQQKVKAQITPDADAKSSRSAGAANVSASKRKLNFNASSPGGTVSFVIKAWA